MLRKVVVAIKNEAPPIELKNLPEHTPLLVAHHPAGSGRIEFDEDFNGWVLKGGTAKQGAKGWSREQAVAYVLGTGLDIYVDQPKLAPRYKAQASKLNTEKTAHWIVMDELNQMDVYHWYGRTAEEKCKAVAFALNALNHGKE